MRELTPLRNFHADAGRGEKFVTVPFSTQRKQRMCEFAILFFLQFGLAAVRCSSIKCTLSGRECIRGGFGFSLCFWMGRPFHPPKERHSVKFRCAMPRLRSPMMTAMIEVPTEALDLGHFTICSTQTTPQGAGRPFALV